jgi:RNA polymerase sigma factor (sigma-70 family)
MNPYQLKQTAFRKHLEREHQEWLAAGMTEADIYRIHFGEEHENGRGGDYGTWLSERAQIRGDRHFAPGVPQSLESVRYEGDEYADHSAANEIRRIEAKTDINAAINALPTAQANLVRAVYEDDITPAQYAERVGMSKANAYKLWRKAKTKLNEFLAGVNLT